MKVLLVIDMQNVCVGEKHGDFFKYDNEQLIAKVNKAIENNEGNLVVYIKNVMKNNFISKFAPVHAFEGTEEVELVEGLNKVSEYIFTKYKGDAFSNDGLVAFLKSKNVNHIEVVGVDGGGCVALTAIGAIKRGYKVTVNTQAIGTMFYKKQEKHFKKLKQLGADFI